MPAKAAKKAAPSAPPTFSPQVPRSQPVRIEIRIDGRIKFAQLAYDPEFDLDAVSVTFTANMEPTWIDPPQLAAPTRFVDQYDIRDGEEFIPRVHSGRRDIIEPTTSSEEEDAE